MDNIQTLLDIINDTPKDRVVSASRTNLFGEKDDDRIIVEYNLGQDQDYVCACYPQDVLNGIISDDIPTKVILDELFSEVESNINKIKAQLHDSSESAMNGTVDLKQQEEEMQQKLETIEQLKKQLQYGSTNLDNKKELLENIVALTNQIRAMSTQVQNAKQQQDNLLNELSQEEKQSLLTSHQQVSDFLRELKQRYARIRKESEDCSNKLQSIQTKHTELVTQMATDKQAQKEVSDTQIQQLKDCNSELTALQQKNQDLSSQLVTLTQQVQTLTEQEGTISKESNENKTQLNVTLAENTKLLTQIEELNTTIQTTKVQTETAINELKKQHAEELSAQLQQYEQQLNEQKQTLNTQYEQQLKEQQTRCNQDLDVKQVEINKYVKELQEEKQLCQEQIKVKQELLQTLEQQQETIKKTHEEALTKQTTDYEAQVQRLKEDHKQELQAYESTCTTNVQQTQSQQTEKHEKELASLQASHRQELDSLTKSHQTALKSEQDKYEEIKQLLDDTQTKHQQELNQKQQQHTTLEQELTKLRETHMKEIQKQTKESQLELDNARKEYQQLARSLEAEHSQKLTSEQQKLQEQKQVCEDKILELQTKLEKLEKAFAQLHHVYKYEPSQKSSIEDNEFESMEEARDTNSKLYIKSTIEDVSKLPAIFRMVNRNTPAPIPTQPEQRFLSILKSALAVTRLLTRNPLSLRLAALSQEDFDLVFQNKDKSFVQYYDQYKYIFQALSYVQVPFLLTTTNAKDVCMIVGSKGTIPAEHTNALRKIIGDDRYVKFLQEVCKDSTGEQPVVHVETMLVTLVEAMNLLQNQSDAQREETEPLYSFAGWIVRETIKKNQDRIDMENVLFQHHRKQLAEYHKNNAIFTFVKIRSDSIAINKRFKVNMDVNDQVLQVDYSNYEGPYYDKQGEKEITDEKQRVLHPVYTDHFVFGPFTKIFRPHETNKDIAQDPNFQTLLLRLQRLKPVVIIGYGASGSGKTSTLINLKTIRNKRTINEPGVLVHLINKAGADKIFTKIDVSMVELFYDVKADIKQEEDQKTKQETKDEKSTIRKPLYQATKPFTTSTKASTTPSKDDKSKSASSSSTPQDEQPGTSKGKSKLKILPQQPNDIYQPQGFKYSDTNATWMIDGLNDEKSASAYGITKTTAVGDYIVSLMEGRRLIKATTNNPVSSRSHVMVFVKCTNDKGQSTYLIVCDFAGVENEFDCLNEDVINQFLNMKSSDGKLFYENELSKASTKKTPMLEPQDWEDVRKKLTVPQIENTITFLTTVTPAKFFGSPHFNNAKTILNILTGYKYQPIDPTWGERDARKERAEREQNDDLQNHLNLLRISKTKEKPLIIQLQGSLEYEKAMIERKKIAEQICKDRVKEGVFINDSLLELRVFMTWFMKNMAHGAPPFVDMCLPMQCNPYMNQCFGGMDDSTSQSTKAPSSVIVDQMKSKICNSKTTMCLDFSHTTFVLFNVINLSTNANNPPPTQYTDLSGLMQEYNRLKNLSLYDARLLNDPVNFLTNERRVRQIFIDDIRGRQTIQTYSPSTKARIYELIDKVQQSASNENDIEVQLVYLQQLIEYCTNVNAVSTIGTMEFTDMIAKYGVNRTVCNLRTTDETSSIATTPENERDNLLAALRKQREELSDFMYTYFKKSVYKQE